MLAYKSVSRAQPHPVHSGRGPSVPQKMFGPPTCAHTESETTAKFCTVIELHVRKLLHGRPWMLTHDLFAVANFPVSFLFNHAFTQQWFDLPPRASELRLAWRYRNTIIIILVFSIYRKYRFKGLKAKESKKRETGEICVSFCPWQHS